jgi:hypothetical protein
MALMLPTSQSLFYAGDAINLALPTNLLPMDGLRQGGEGIFDLVMQDSIFSSSLVLWETAFFLAEVIFFLSSLFSSFWLIVTWCIVLLLHPLPTVLLGLFVHLPFFFPLHGYAKNCGGVLVYSHRYAKYSRLTLLLYPSISCR